MPKRRIQDKVQMIKFPLQATLHVGDEIREINGISVANQVYYMMLIADGGDQLVRIV